MRARIRARRLRLMNFRPQSKSARIPTRLTPAEAAQLQHRARLLDLTRSSTLRAIAVGNAAPLRRSNAPADRRAQLLQVLELPSGASSADVVAAVSAVLVDAEGLSEVERSHLRGMSPDQAQEYVKIRRERRKAQADLDASREAQKKQIAAYEAAQKKR